MSTLTKQPDLPKPFLSGLKDIFPIDALLTDPADCWTYGYDNSRQHTLPQVVSFAQNHEQVAKTVQLCNQYQVPLTTRGRGTGTTGATVPIRGGLVLTLERMSKVLEFSPDNRYITVEPGLTNQAVQDIVAEQGFFWPPDPTSAAYCTIGGNLACNAAGPRAIKYGTCRENTLGLRAITGEGKEIRTGVITSKGVVGYDLTRLLLGSEGTLAIITEATLKLIPLAEHRFTVQAIYTSVDAAATAITKIMAQPIIPYALEFIDGNAIDLIRHYAETDLQAQACALLMIEVDGPASGLITAVKQVVEAAKNNGLLSIKTAKTESEVEALWHARKALSPTLRKVAPNKINEDVVVPVTEIPALIGGLNKLAIKYQLPIINFGHAGNGNIHVNLLLDQGQQEQREKAHHCLDEIFSLVLELRGTLSGEHGIGLAKREFIGREIEPEALAIMRKIKSQFDPNYILNPDKIFPQI